MVSDFVGIAIGGQLKACKRKVTQKRRKKRGINKNCITIRNFSGVMHCMQTGRVATSAIHWLRLRLSMSPVYVRMLMHDHMAMALMAGGPVVGKKNECTKKNGMVTVITKSKSNFIKTRRIKALWIPQIRTLVENKNRNGIGQHTTLRKKRV